jgi:hypothetical protein
MFGGSLVATSWAVLGLRMEGWPPAMKGRHECVEKQPRTDGKWWSSSFRLGAGLRNLHHKKCGCCDNSDESRTRMNSLDRQPKQWNRGMRLGMWIC